MPSYPLYNILYCTSEFKLHSLRCAHPASSIRERICHDAKQERYGLLFYTASPDADGTFGGLVQQANEVGEHLAKAMYVGKLCSGDPICAQHAPCESPDERWLHGAACHNCALVAETSCEMRNEYLDRALMVPTVVQPDVTFIDRDG